MNRGWLNLAGERVYCHREDDSNSLQEEGELRVEGYLNVELELSVNANMLKQPVAKEIRLYVQKIICEVTKTDAI